MFQSIVISFKQRFLVLGYNSQGILNLPTSREWVEKTAKEDYCLEEFLEEGEERNFMVLCHQNPREIVDFLHKRFIFVKAAGGVVENSCGERLLIQRNEAWDLPKGMVEKGETLKDAAVREVEEETGIKNLHVRNLIFKSYHIYNLYGGWHLKQTSWFAMDCLGEGVTIPQGEEGITKAEWVDRETQRERLQSSFSTMALVDRRS